MTDTISKLPPEAFTGGDGKFKAKLSEAERCACLALARAGIKREILARVFNIDRRTVTNLANPHSLKYKAVRDRLSAMGLGEFTRTYVTEEIAVKVAETARAMRSEDPVDESRGPNPRANGRAGSHVVALPHLSYPHNVDIAFKRAGEDGVEQDGWYYRDRSDPDTPDAWLHNGEESLQTSQACLDFFTQNVV